MKIDNEQVETFHRFDLELSEKESQLLIKYAHENIANDTEFLINYAINDILQKKISKYDEES